MKLNQIKANPDNPRSITEEALQKLCHSIKDFPKMMELRPIIIDSTNTVLAGNMRLKALKKLGYKEIPDTWVKKADQLTEEEKHRFIVQDNANAGVWDVEKLLAEWDETDLEDWGVDIGDLELPEQEATATEDGYEPPEEIETNIKRGDLITFHKDGKELHRLLCGDSTLKEDVEKVMNGEKSDMVFTDPPYGVNYSAKNKFLNAFDKGNRVQKDIENDTDGIDMGILWAKVFANTKEVLKKGASFYITFSDDKLLLLLLQTLRDVKMPERQILVWVKNNHVLGRSTYNYKHEMILFGWKEGAAHKYYGEFDTTVWECNKPLKADLHPTMKPIELIERALKNSSAANDIILDTFLGSGSTMVACHQLKRKCYGIEIDEKYCQVIVDRMQKLDPDLEVRYDNN
jgi:DNA modification methylase